MDYLITAAFSALSLEVIRQLVAREHKVTGLVRKSSQVDRVLNNGAEALIVDPGEAETMTRAVAQSGAKVILNLAPQRSNSLLHDGHAWGKSTKRLIGQTQVLLQAARANDITYLLHASYAFLYSSALPGGRSRVDESAPLHLPDGNELFAAAVEAEKMIATNRTVPVSILRVGYLYGPQSRSLALYENSFKLHRPYYAGPTSHRVNFVHISDAARAVVLAAEQQPRHEIINVVDGSAVSFGTFIDTYAKFLGYRKPWHLPRTLLRLAPYLITPQQIKQLDLVSPQVDNSKARELLGWQPEFPDYEQGLAQTIGAVDKRR